MTDAPRPDVERIEGMFLDVSQGGHGFYVHRQDVLSLVAYIRTLEASIATLKRELAAADTSIATLSAGDRYGDGLTRAARHIEQKAEWFGEGHQVTGHDLRRWAEQIRALEPDTAP